MVGIMFRKDYLLRTLFFYTPDLSINLYIPPGIMSLSMQNVPENLLQLVYILKVKVLLKIN